MIFLSSFRPHATCPPAIWQHQIAANRSWNRVAEKIFYYNQSDPRMGSDKTGFLSVPGGGKPTIKQMAAQAGNFNDWSCIINADIIVPKKFLRVEDAIRSEKCGCVVSSRYNFTDDTSTGKVTDHGLDFFAATPAVWKAVAHEISPDYQMGRIVWDNWMINFFMARFGNYCFDITPAKVIFHPIHEDRADQNWDFNKKDPFLENKHRPFHFIET